MTELIRNQQHEIWHDPKNGETWTKNQFGYMESMAGQVIEPEKPHDLVPGYPPQTGETEPEAAPEADYGPQEYAQLVIRAADVDHDMDWVIDRLKALGAVFTPGGNGIGFVNIVVPVAAYDKLDLEIATLEREKAEKKAPKAARKSKAADLPKPITPKVVFEAPEEPADQDQGESVAAGVTAPLVSPPPDTAIATAGTASDIARATDSSENETYFVDPETGEILFTVEETAELRSFFKGDKFAICDEETLKWFVKKVRARLDRATSIKAEAEAIINENKRKAESLMKRFTPDVVEYLLNGGIDRTQDGKLKAKHLKTLEGAVYLEETGGPECYEPKAFDFWWESLDDDEKRAYPHEEKIVPNKKEFRAHVEAGAEYPGWRNLAKNPYGAIKIAAAPAPRKKSETNEGEQ